MAPFREASETSVDTDHSQDDLAAKLAFERDMDNSIGAEYIEHSISRPLPQEAFPGAQSMATPTMEDAPKWEDSIDGDVKPLTTQCLEVLREQHEDGGEDISMHQDEAVSSDTSSIQDAEPVPESTPGLAPLDTISGSRHRGRPKKTSRAPTTPSRVSPGRPKGTKNNTRHKASGTKRRVSARVAEAATSIASTASPVTAGATKGRHKKGTARKVTKPKNKPTTELESKQRFTEDSWEIESILDSVIEAGTLEHYYLVKWKGYSSKSNTWEPKSNLGNCRAAIEAFEKANKSRK
ncbi:uncharacterized protein J7T54_000656 [Emericellopsis cladophorae]|uniref:Chromo domain-containing protein n=1 Tax=Emericellopsis cladophorae TaxID=2686198 RepID=A0A9Q0BGA7_9HYPO|nr:uncharacterized protein J7T54_000656 [Emericellopsis cladophorae]KAI6783154.1 hypothetical protein J7T54_000656 [Emericellopsis cladophorae]